MGEAKRRRLLDPNYGKSKIPYVRKKIIIKILNKPDDLEIIPTDDFRNYSPRLTKYHLILPTPSQQNNPPLINVIDAPQTNNQIAPNHWHEWVVNSAVDPKLTALNVRSLSGSEVYEYL